MVERPFKVQIPFILLAMPFMVAMTNAQDSGPWVVAIIVYMLTGGIRAMNFWPIAYRTPLFYMVGHFLLIALGAFLTALICALLVTGNLDGLFAARAR